MDPLLLFDELENDLNLLITEIKKKKIHIKEKIEICIIKIKNYNSIITSNKSNLLNSFEFPLDEIIDIINIGANIDSQKITYICLTCLQRVLLYILYLIDNKDIIKKFKEINIEAQIEKITNKLFDLTFNDDKKILVKILQITLTAFSPQYIEYYNRDIIDTLLKILYSIYYSSLHDNAHILYQTCCAAYKQLLNSLIDICNKESLDNITESSISKEDDITDVKNEHIKNNNDHNNTNLNEIENDDLKNIDFYFENFHLQYDVNNPIDLINIPNFKNTNNMKNKNKLLSLIHYLCYCCFVNIRSKYYLDSSSSSFECDSSNKNNKMNINEKPDNACVKKDYNLETNIKSTNENNNNSLSNINEQLDNKYKNNKLLSGKENEAKNIEDTQIINNNISSEFDKELKKASFSSNNINNNHNNSKESNFNNVDNNTNNAIYNSSINSNNKSQFSSEKIKNSNKKNDINGNIYNRNQKDGNKNIYNAKKYNIKDFFKILKNSNSKIYNNNNKNNFDMFSDNMNIDSYKLKNNILSSYNKNNLILPLNFCLDLLYIFLNNYEHFLDNYEFFKLLKFEIAYIILISLKSNLHIDIFYRCLKIFIIICHKYFQYFLGEIKFLLINLIQYLSLTKNFSKIYIVLNFFFYLFDNTLTVFNMYKYFYSPMDNTSIKNNDNNTRIKNNDNNTNTNLNKQIKNNDNIKSDEGPKGKSKKKKKKKKKKKINHEATHIPEDTKNDMDKNKEENLHCEKTNLNIGEDKEKYIQNDVNNKKLPLINSKQNIYEEKKKISEKTVNTEDNSIDSGINIEYQMNYCKDDDNGFIFIKIVECISKIIHELLFLYSIDITKIYPHLKIFKYDRVYTSKKTEVHIFNKTGNHKSSNNNVEGQNIDNKNEESIKSGSNDGVHTNGKNYYSNQEIEVIKNKNNYYRKRENKDNEHQMCFYNFLNYPLILPNNSANPREDFYLYKFSTEKKTNKAMFDYLYYNNIDEIILLASSIDNILSLINSFYVILLNILTKSFNQYCFAAIDLNDEHSLYEERKLSSNCKNGILQYSMNLLDTHKNESKCKSIKSLTSSTYIQSDNTSNFEYEIDRRIKYYNNNSYNNTDNYTIDHKNHHTSINNNQQEKVEFNSISICPQGNDNAQNGILTYNEDDNNISYKNIIKSYNIECDDKNGGKNNSYTEQLSLFNSVFNLTCRYFISSLSLAFSYTNTIDSCFFSGFQKLIFMSTHLNVNICTNACMQTLTKCSSIFTLENSPFFLNILQSFEKKGNKNENNYNSKKNKTGTNSSKVLSNNTYRENEIRVSKSMEINSNHTKNVIDLNDSNENNAKSSSNMNKDDQKKSYKNDNNKTDTKSNYISDESYNHINFIAYSANSISDSEVYINIDDGKTCSHKIVHLYGNMNSIDEIEVVEETNEINNEIIIENDEKKKEVSDSFVNGLNDNKEQLDQPNNSSNNEIKRVYNNICEDNKNSYEKTESYSEKLNTDCVDSIFFSYKSILNEDLLKYYDDCISIILKESYYINNDLNNMKYILSIKTMISIFYIYGDMLNFDDWLKLINIFVEVNYVYKYISSIENKTIEFLNFLYYINKSEDNFTFSLNTSAIDSNGATMQHINSKNIEFWYFILRFIQKNPVLFAEITVIFSSISHFLKNTIYYNITTLINILNAINFMIFNQFFKHTKKINKDDNKPFVQNNVKEYNNLNASTSINPNNNIENLINKEENDNSILTNQKFEDKYIDNLNNDKHDKNQIECTSTTKKDKNKKNRPNCNKKGKICKNELSKHQKDKDNPNDNSNNMNIQSEHIITEDIENKNKENIVKPMDNNNDDNNNRIDNKLFNNNGDIYEIFYYYLSHFDPIYCSYFMFYSDNFFIKNKKGNISKEYYDTNNVQYDNIQNDGIKFENNLYYNYLDKKLFQNNYYIDLKKLDNYCIFEDFYPLHMIENLCVININNIKYIYNTCCINILLLSLCNNNGIQKKSIDTLFHIIIESVAYYKYNFEIQFLLFKPFFLFIINPYASYRSYFINSFLNFIRKNASFFNKDMWLFIIFLLYISFKKELKNKTLKNTENDQKDSEQISEENISNIKDIFNILEVIIVDYIEEIPVCKIMEVIIHMLILFSSLDTLSNNISFRAINFLWSIVDYILNRSDLLKDPKKYNNENKDYYDNAKEEKSNILKTEKNIEPQLLYTCVVKNKKMYIYENKIKMKNIKMKSFFIFILNYLMKLCFDERIEVRNCSIKTIMSILSTHIYKFDFFFYKTSICLLLRKLCIKYFYILMEYLKLEKNNSQNEDNNEISDKAEIENITIDNLNSYSNDISEKNESHIYKDNDDYSNFIELDDFYNNANCINIDINDFENLKFCKHEISQNAEISNQANNSDIRETQLSEQVENTNTKLQKNENVLRKKFIMNFVNLINNHYKYIETARKKKRKKNKKELLNDIEENALFSNINNNKISEDKNYDLYDYVNENFNKIIIHHSRDSKLKQWVESFILIIEGCNRILLEQKNYKKYYFFYDIFVKILKTILFIKYNKTNMFELHISIIQILNNIFMSKLSNFNVNYFTMKNSITNKNRYTDHINIFDKSFIYIYNYACSTDDQKIKDLIIKLITENMKNIFCDKWIYFHSLVYLHLFQLLYSTNSNLNVLREDEENYSFSNYYSILNKLYFDYFISDTREYPCEKEVNDVEKNINQMNSNETNDENSLELDKEIESDNNKKINSSINIETDINRNLNNEKIESFKNKNFTIEYKKDNFCNDPLNIYNILENNKSIYNEKDERTHVDMKKDIYKNYINGEINSDVFIIIMNIFKGLKYDEINLLINEELGKSIKYLLCNLLENKEKRKIFKKLIKFLFDDKMLFNENSDEIIDKITLNDTYNKFEINIRKNEITDEDKECNRLFTLNYKKLYPLNNYIESFQMFSLGLFNYLTPCYIFFIHNKFNLYPNYQMNIIFSIILCNLIRQEYCNLYYFKENRHNIISFINMFPYIIANHIKCFLYNLNNNSSFVFYESVIILLKITYSIIQNIEDIPDDTLFKYWYSVVFAIEKILFANCNNDKIDMLDIMLIKLIRNSYLFHNSHAPLNIKIYLTKIISELNDKRRKSFSSWTLQILFEEYEKMMAENNKNRYYTTFITLVMLKKCVLTLKSFSSENPEDADEILFILHEMKNLKCYYSYVGIKTNSSLKSSEDKAHLFICYPYLLDCLNTENTKFFTTAKELLRLITIMP
ncbi:hypothetical protein YYC_05636 [Plasmodium yoelii 17X]|uniref:Mon2/Sec7/BIG1-like dimerisation and cyclophilin-binding domain-containing protein n=1 Tax=Plasmodium yoelii 17X TaxID=1323249 RepID=V7PCU9_PLAYE|nr:hypothetical protein YYC_05636 [Plasmodium yoelii 17X]